ncbi:NAD(P)/FAD-dependent oxidoreductase [Paenibacillus albidus]|uniref:NAD(P)/FAD-dependent oxidoreductase n=1 Tax=Paenibacillus albidus TaxID=2041023 RepID=UPI001BE6835E|nr:FAD-dependent oxidoreductase [Paenibacillus albidus]MBT2288896.1 NAD(P)/FAD-dependent oxidoreductase [Paenibacillus albidus]
MEKNRHYVIVGSGVASVYAAKAIRDHDLDAEISIVGAEPGLPYHRIKLSKGLFTDLHQEKVSIKKEKWFVQNRINLQANTTVTSINTVNRTVTSTDGQMIAYHKLLLCTGAANRKLDIAGAALPGVHSIRDRNDADMLKAALQPGDRIAIIGGGVQGVETAWSFIEAGYAVTIIEAAPRLMIRQLDERSADLLEQRMLGRGADIRLGQGVAKITGSGRAEGIELQDGSHLPCEHVVYSIGIVPNTTLARQIGLEVRNGILVDEYMQTSAGHVYAAGDNAEFEGRVDGLWGSAIEQGTIAGSNMTGNPATYTRPVPLTLFNAFDTPLFSIGQVDEQCDASVTGLTEEYYSRLFIKDGVICGAIVFDNAAASLPYKTAIEQGIRLDGLDLQSSSLSGLMDEVTKRSQYQHQ